MLTCRIVIQTGETTQQDRIDALATMLDRIRLQIQYRTKLAGKVSSWWDVLKSSSDATSAIVTFSEEERVPAGRVAKTLTDPGSTRTGIPLA